MMKQQQQQKSTAARYGTDALVAEMVAQARDPAPAPAPAQAQGHSASAVENKVLMVGAVREYTYEEVQILIARAQRMRSEALGKILASGLSKSVQWVGGLFKQRETSK